MRKKYAYLVQHFKSNGFCNRLMKGIATYTVKFKEWTPYYDIALFECSDHTIRLIPIFALKGLKKHPLPKQNINNKTIYFNPPTHS